MNNIQLYTASNEQLLASEGALIELKSLQNVVDIWRKKIEEI